MSIDAAGAPTGVSATAHLRPVGPPRTLREYLSGMWALRDFALALPLAQIKARNAHASLGSLWNVLQPLLHVGVYYLLFGLIVDGRRGIENYVAFLVVGLFTFFYTQKIIQNCAGTISRNERLLTSLAFPRALLPISAGIGQAVMHVPVVGVMLLLVLMTGEPLRWTWLLLPFLLVLQTLFNVGAGLLVARLSYRFRDVEYVLPYALRIWMYMSVLLFALERVPDDPGWLRPLFQVNPMYAIVEVARNCVLYGKVDAFVWASCALWSIGMFVVGFVYFRRAEATYGNR